MFTHLRVNTVIAMKILILIITLITALINGTAIYTKF
jgi:hypothetical protein